MIHPSESESPSYPKTGGVVAPAPAGAGNDSERPTLTSGFGAVIEKERELQSATEGSFGKVRGYHSANVDRILHHQHSRVSANIALLEQRYKALPIPERFVNWHDRGRPPAKPRHIPRDEAELLPDLVAQHTRLLTDVEALIERAPHGQRGELILSEVSRSHEEMAWMLTALLKDDESARGIALDAGSNSSAKASPAQERWENEGGPVRIDRRLS